MAEATAQLTKGLELLTSLPDSVSRQRQELELQIALGRALATTQGYAAPPPVGETYARAHALCGSWRISIPAVPRRLSSR
jgi:hypothetical protein